MISDGLVLFTGSAKLNIPIRTKDYIVWSLAQPLYIPYVGIMGLAGKFRWKEWPARMRAKPIVIFLLVNSISLTGQEYKIMLWSFPVVAVEMNSEAPGKITFKT